MSDDESPRQRRRRLRRREGGIGINVGGGVRGRLADDSSDDDDDDYNDDDNNNNNDDEIEELHRLAILNRRTTYIDPATGFTVFTELAHLRRGRCCGNACRHCPYGWENVPTAAAATRKEQDQEDDDVDNDDDDNDNDVYRDAHEDEKNNGGLGEGKKSGSERRRQQTKPSRKKAKATSGDAESVRAALARLEFLATLSLSESAAASGAGNGEAENARGSEATAKITETIESIERDEMLTTLTTNTNTKTTKTGGRKGGQGTSKNVPYTRTGDNGTSHLFTGERRPKNDAAFEAMGAVDELCSVVGVVHAMLVEKLDEEEEREKKESGGVGNDEDDVVDLPEWLLDVMSRLFDAGSLVAKPPRRHSRPARSGDDNTGEDVDDDEDTSDNTDTDTSNDNDNDNRFSIRGKTREREQGRKREGKTYSSSSFDERHVSILEQRIDRMTEPLPELTSFILPTGSVLSAQLHVARTVCRRAERRVVPLVREGTVDPNVMTYLNRLSDFLFTAARYCNYYHNSGRADRFARAREGGSNDRRRGERGRLVGEEVLYRRPVVATAGNEEEKGGGGKTGRVVQRERIIVRLRPDDKGA